MIEFADLIVMVATRDSIHPDVPVDVSFIRIYIRRASTKREDTHSRKSRPDTVTMETWPR